MCTLYLAPLKKFSLKTRKYLSEIFARTVSYSRRSRVSRGPSVIYIISQLRALFLSTWIIRRVYLYTKNIRTIELPVLLFLSYRSTTEGYRRVRTRYRLRARTYEYVVVMQCDIARSWDMRVCVHYCAAWFRYIRPEIYPSPVSGLDRGWWGVGFVLPDFVAVNAFSSAKNCAVIALGCRFHTLQRRNLPMRTFSSTQQHTTT